MDKEKKNLYVFGYGFSLIIPFFIIWHAWKVHFSFGYLIIFVSCFIFLLFIVTRISSIKPLYNTWILSIQIWALVKVMHSGQSWVPVALLGFAVIILLIAVIKVKKIKSLYDIWMTITHFIGSVFSGIILSVLFYGVFGVAGIVLRLLRKDLLDQKICLNRESYWCKKNKEAFNMESYTKQF